MKVLGNIIIFLANYYDKAVRHYALENTQNFINWQDNLNKISVR